VALVAVFTTGCQVFRAAAFVTILVNRSRSGSIGCHEFQVFKCCISVQATARSSALTVLEPIDTGIAGPLANSPCHLRDVLRHVRQVRAVTSCLHNLSFTLGHDYRIANKLAIALMEVNFYMELIVGVDANGTSR